MRLLILNAGQANEAVFVLRSGATIVGRDEDSGIFIPNLSLSRRHARIDVTDDAVLVTDLKSKNGTYVNEAPIQNRPLIPGDKLRCGQAVFTYLDDATLRSPRQATLAPPSVPRESMSFAELSAPKEDDSVLRSGLARFFPAKTVAWMAEHGHLGTLEVDVTVLAAEIGGVGRDGFEAKPHVVVAMLNDFFPFVDDIVTRHEGMLEKYLAEGLLAVWGVPFSREDDADRAVEAAIEIQRASAAIHHRWHERLGRPLQVHVGLSSDRAACGNVGSASYVQYATVGAAANVANRVRAAAGPGEILICGETAHRLKRADANLEPEASRWVQGGAEPLEVHRVGWM
jgi:class 3 adenylate cyclase